MKFPYNAPFALPFFIAWCAENFVTSAPGQTLELTDRQYSWLCDLTRTIPKDFAGIPIVFLDAPKTPV